MKNTIQDLVDLLLPTTKSNYDSVIRSFDFKAIDFKPFETWSLERYTRNCIYKDADFEFILLCWEAGHETPIHDHNQEDCWVCLLEGTINEAFYKLNATNNLVKTGAVDIKGNDITFMNDSFGFHKLKNSFNGRSVSLHIYAKPISKCRSFDEKSKTFLDRTLNYDSASVK